jgi:hypothetical protein
MTSMEAAGVAKHRTMQNYVQRCRRIYIVLIFHALELTN